MNLRCLLPLLTGACVVLQAEPLRLDRSTVIEVVNEVERITMPDEATAPAVVSMELKAPDRLRTGRASRAELRAADGTITRVGAGTLFAFDPQGRELRLSRGSLLFHSPSGRGGGTIRTPAASATVLGTTLIAAATPDGGYKLLVLEGRARVEFPGGPSLAVEAGQMTFVRPAGGGLGGPGPVIPFDLARQVRSSKLVNGFSRPLPSQAKIERAVETQAKAVNQGRYTTTGFLVFAATSDTQVSGIETAGPDAEDSLRGEFTTPQRLALNTSVTLAGQGLPEARLFRTPLLVPPTESAFLNKESDILVTGLLADTITVTSPTVSLAGWNGPKEFQLVGKTAIRLAGPLQFAQLGNVNYLRFFTPQVLFPDSGTVGVTFGPGGAGTFYFDTGESLSLGGLTLASHGGGLILQSHSGDVALSRTVLQVDGLIGAPVVVEGAVNLHSLTGSVTVDGAQVNATGGTVAISAGTVVTLRLSRFSLGGNFWVDAAGAVTLDALTFSAPGGSVCQATGNDVLTARNSDFGAFAQINLGARTLVLESVNFPAGSIVRLVSEQGLLAPNPNTGAAVLTGYVNFVRNVTYASDPAQDHVPVAAGGTGRRPGDIQISKPH